MVTLGRLSRLSPRQNAEPAATPVAGHRRFGSSLVSAWLVQPGDELQFSVNRFVGSAADGSGDALNRNQVGDGVEGKGPVGDNDLLDASTLNHIGVVDTVGDVLDAIE